MELSNTGAPKGRHEGSPGRKPWEDGRSASSPGAGVPDMGGFPVAGWGGAAQTGPLTKKGSFDLK